MKTPSFQADHDINQPLPPEAPSDDCGVLRSLDRCHTVNLFRLRVELAHIQGKTYDLLYSNRAASIDNSERQQRTAEVQAKLSLWYERIPSVFRIDDVVSSVGPNELVQMTKLFHQYLLTLFMAHGLYSEAAEWVKRIGAVSSVTTSDIATTQDRFGSVRSSNNQSPPSPSGWDQLVSVSRGCMKLFHLATEIECLAWYA